MTYLQVLVAMKWHEKKPFFQQAMVAEGLWEEVAAGAQQTQVALAKRDIEKREESRQKGPQEHREIRRLRELKGLQAESILGQLGPLVPLPNTYSAPPPVEDLVEPKPKRPRNTRSKAVVEIHGCLLCGSVKHNVASCPRKPRLKVRSSRCGPNLAVVSPNTDKAIAKLVGRLKYTPITQRSEQYEKRPRQASRVYMRTSFLRMARASPKLSAWMSIQDGLLCNLCGAACVNPQCEQTDAKGYGSTRTLGQLTSGPGSILTGNPNISSTTVFYRCDHCRHRVRVNHGSRLYGSVGGGNKGVSLMNLAFWNCSVGISATHTTLQLDVNEGLVSQWYRRAWPIPNNSEAILNVSYQFLSININVLVQQN